ncbi:DNA N-6-adenine-methyltransferase [Photobacterium halotolerans]|uniref:DNA N-6-adenine-methyltransferase n=1 Tax=Photobacterium halotolerans TaxID=265726 RepID=UPI0003FF1273|nr:DNA N-6-adenine-methyltransferase [Photobacterium halotolerans]
MAILIRSRTTVDDKNRWGTQWKCFWDAKALYGREFNLDVCAEPETAKVNRFYTSLEWLEEKAGNYFKRGTGFGNTFFNPHAKIVGFDALQQAWEPHWWCNPPFDMKMQFVSKAAAEARAGNPGMMLLPYEPLTGWWQQGIEGVAAAVYEPDGRYNFLKTDGITQKKGVNFGSVFVLFTPGYFPTTQRIRFKRGIAEDLTINFREKLEAAA